MLLSLHYVPDAGAAEVLGQPATIVHAQQTIVRGQPKGLDVSTPSLPTDTLAIAGEYALVPADTNDVVPSVAASSVSLTIEHHVAGGSVVRSIHYANTSLLILVLLILFVLLVIRRAWLTEGTVWMVVIVGVVLLLAAAFTGRLLPDDVYSNVSSSIVRHELAEFPLGSSLVTMLGLDASGSSRLSVPFAIHTLFIPVVLAVGVCLLWRRLGSPTLRTVVHCAIILVFTTFLTMPYYPVQDVRGSVQQMVTVTPWWPFVVPSALVSWLGSELAGYLTMAAFLALVTLPVYLRSSQRNT